MYGAALKHFIKVMENSNDAELFLVLKSAFNCLQILTDNQYIEAAVLMIKKIEALLPDLIRIKKIKKDYISTAEHEKKNTGYGSSQIEEFSISTGSFLPKAMTSPKSPWLTEYEFYLSYFKTRIAMHDTDEDTRRKWVKRVSLPV